MNYEIFFLLIPLAPVIMMILILIKNVIFSFLPSKKCYLCKQNKPLILFRKNHNNYNIPYNRGRNFACRSCENDQN